MDVAQLIKTHRERKAIAIFEKWFGKCDTLFLQWHNSTVRVSTDKDGRRVFVSFANGRGRLINVSNA